MAAITPYLTQTATVLPPTGSTTDRYNNTLTTFGAGTAYAAHLQQTDAVEIQTDRDTVVSNWLLFLPVEAVITARSRVLVAGRTYEVIGAPDVLHGPGFIDMDHVEARLRLVESG